MRRLAVWYRPRPASGASNGSTHACLRIWHILESRSQVLRHNLVNLSIPAHFDVFEDTIVCITEICTSLQAYISLRRLQLIMLGQVDVMLSRSIFRRGLYQRSFFHFCVNSSLLKPYRRPDL